MKDLKIKNQRSKFFPNKKSPRIEFKETSIEQEKRKKKFKQIGTRDFKLNIPDSIRDFSKIKSEVDKTPQKNNSAKINRLKQQIKSGNYKVNPDLLADKILKEEF